MPSFLFIYGHIQTGPLPNPTLRRLSSRLLTEEQPRAGKTEPGRERGRQRQPELGVGEQVSEARELLQRRVRPALEGGLEEGPHQPVRARGAGEEEGEPIGAPTVAAQEAVGWR